MTVIRSARGMMRSALRRTGWDVVRVAAADAIRQFSSDFGSHPRKEAAPSFGTFRAGDGSAFPLMRGYRYSIKQSWRMIPELFGLEVLARDGALDPNNVRQFRSFIGDRTITVPIEEIAKFARPLLKQHEARFEPDTVAPGRRPVARQSDDSIRNSIASVAAGVRSHLSLLPDDCRDKQLRVLDIGCGRGLSTAAFALMGYATTGLDNDYGAGLRQAGLSGAHRRLAELVGPTISFRQGDMTSCSQIADGSFDLIYSASVLEHIGDIDAAFAEMWRVLKPRGVMIHSYNPFWAFNGGHAFGTLDAPWLHAMLDAEDHLRYMDELCPFEAPAAKAWIAGALNRRLTIAAMQGAVLKASFDLLRWRESIDKPRHLESFSPCYLRFVHRHQTDVTLADMLATNIVFVARKRES